ncbi:T9SS type A sorting domain-containing protein [Neolewinella lacunae]|uniref:T9SS type A sorting domain-containing protein n=1 Tax=Neolewinella lacunae TaxID=1517758 RepID=A0A923T9M2_9BACT|nr:T9SS type A sorting domain-containing protein [Neolewinella lacunae]MBC6995218.1 T9SS type A sorting domain-containing protein [Neolewinella lacunae]MDN3635473.1 T9SS type A sorting domain-containing protein [Neolewinella lacunae]
MRRLYVLLLALCSGLTAGAQTVISVPPGSTLNDVITADSNRIYELTRGAIYFVNSPIAHQGFTLHLRAAGNEQFARPLIVSDPPSADVEINALFEARGNLILEGLHLTQRSTLGVVFERMIRARANDIRITVDDCLMDDSGQTVFRLDNANTKIYVRNSVASRLGEPSNPDNGRFIDDRGNLVDSIVLENNLFYNITSRLIRDGGGEINYFKFNQNTVDNVGQRCMAIGPVGTLEVTNNIFANGAFLGRQFSLDPAEQDDRAVLDPDTTALGISNWLISHNNFFRTPALVEATPFTQVDMDTIEQVPNFSVEAELAVAARGTEATIINDVLNFANPAPQPLAWIMAHHSEMDAPAWDHSGIDVDAVLSTVGDGSILRYSTYHDYGYAQGAGSYRAGTEGQPLGANLPDFEFSTRTRDLFVAANILYYPNPVADRLFVRHLNGTDISRIVIYDLMGRPLQVVHNVNNDRHELDLAHLPSGTYLLSLVDSRGGVSARQVVKQ